MKVIICPNENCKSSNVIHNYGDFWYCLNCKNYFVPYHLVGVPPNNGIPLQSSSDNSSKEES